MGSNRKRLYQDQPGLGDLATTIINEGTADGEVEITVDKEGAIGNNYEVEVVDPGQISQSLSANLSGWTLTISLATDGAGDILMDGSNDATAVASAVDGVSEFSTTASGDGSAHVGTEGPLSFDGGADNELAGPVPEGETWVIDKIVATNVTSSTAFFSLSIVPENGNVSQPNRVIEEKDVGANDYEIIDGPIILQEGEKLYGLIETTNAITLTIDVSEEGIKHYN